MKYRLKQSVLKKIAVVMICILAITITIILVLPKSEEVDLKTGNDFYNEIKMEREKVKRPVKLTIDYPQTNNEKIDVIINEYISSIKDEYRNVEVGEKIKQVSVSYEKYYYSEELVSLVFDKKIEYKDRDAEYYKQAYTFEMVEGKELLLTDLFDNKISYDSFESNLKNQLQENSVSEERIQEILISKNNFIINDEGIWINADNKSEAGLIKIENTISMKSIYRPFVEGRQPQSEEAMREEELAQLRSLYEGKKLIALTFDDGPHKTFTPQLLDILASKDVKVSFFVLGRNADANPNLVYRAIQEGHTVGSHSYTHSNLTKLSPDAIASEMEMTRKSIYNASWEATTMMRPPYGANNEAVTNAADASIVMWSVDSLDWKTRDTASIINEVRSKTKDGSIVLMHDIYGASVDAVGPIVDSLRSEGYTFVSVDTLLKVRSGMQKGGIYYSGR